MLLRVFCQPKCPPCVEGDNSRIMIQIVNQRCPKSNLPKSDVCSPAAPGCSLAGYGVISPSTSDATSIVSWPPASYTAGGQLFERH